MSKKNNLIFISCQKNFRPQKLNGQFLTESFQCLVLLVTNFEISDQFRELES